MQRTKCGAWLRILRTARSPETRGGGMVDKGKRAGGTQKVVRTEKPGNGQASVQDDASASDAPETPAGPTDDLGTKWFVVNSAPAGQEREWGA